MTIRPKRTIRWPVLATLWVATMTGGVDAQTSGPTADQCATRTMIPCARQATGTQGPWGTLPAPRAEGALDPISAFVGGIAAGIASLLGAGRGSQGDPDPLMRWTAVYDITAHEVTLPDGTRLEAHSGLGPRLDDPGGVREVMRGATEIPIDNSQ